MIACIGWGSLLWNPGELPLAGAWSADGERERAEEYIRRAPEQTRTPYRARIEEALGLAES